MYSTTRLAILSAVAVTGSSLAGGAAADQIADFYKGKTITHIVGAGAGGAYDLVSRIVVAHMGKHLPGAPNFVVSNMAGASSLTMMNYLTNPARKDGTMMGMTNPNIALELPLKMLSKGGGKTLFDVSKLQWIGSPMQQPHVLWVWHTAPAKTFEDLKTNKVILGSTAVGGDNYTLPLILNRLMGAKIEIVSGYKGQPEIFAATEQGEVQGNSAILPNLTSAKPDWFRDGKVRVLVQFGTDRMRQLPEVPTAIELASTPSDKAMLRFYARKFSMAYPFVMAAEVPLDRVTAIRAAFDATMKDAAFLKDAARLGLDIDPFNGAEMEALIKELDSAPKEIVDRVAEFIEIPKK
ncbi:MAG: tripartite tricarboxylate transporter substrate-binding protein [Beijerinckiaceae bacterium]|nr:tripartite tricarboxylate transporter substrate-binding protein [Beijerinckiaceae bacterium]